jgi:hypothetical protein
MIRKTITIGILSGLLLTGINTAYASGGDFTIYPTYKHDDNSGWIVMDVNPNQIIKDSVTLENLSDETQTIRIEYLEATEQSGNFIPADAADYNDIGRWTNIEKTTYTLAPHEKIRVPIVFSIPEDADLKQYTGAVYAVKEFLNPQNIKVAVRIGVRTYINVTDAPLAVQTNIFTSTPYVYSVYFIFSLLGVIAALFYNIIFILEKRKHAKKFA